MTSKPEILEGKDVQVIMPPSIYLSSTLLYTITVQPVTKKLSFNNIKCVLALNDFKTLTPRHRKISKVWVYFLFCQDQQNGKFIQYIPEEEEGRMQQINGPGREGRPSLAACIREERGKIECTEENAALRFTTLQYKTIHYTDMQCALQ